MKKNYFGLINNSASLFLKSSRLMPLGVLRFFFILFLFFFSLTATYAQSCNVVKNGTFTSDISNWTSSQPSGTGWFSYSGQAYIDRDGIDGTIVAPISLKQNLTGLIGNSLTLTFDIRGQNAGRRACNTTALLEVKIGGVTYMTIANPGGNTQIFSNNIATFNGANYSETNFPITVGGLNATISENQLTQGRITLTIPWTTGMTTANLEFVATSSNTAYNSSCGAGGGDDWYLDNIKLEPSSPNVYAIPNSTLCFGNTAAITLSGSQLGVNYELRRGSTVVQTIAGTGNALAFTSQTTAGIYTIVGVIAGANAATSGCATTMTGSVTINPNLTPAVSIAASPAGPICAGTSVTFTATPTNGGTVPVYQWKLNGVNVGTNASTYINAALMNGDVVTCVLTSNATPCLTTPQATSNPITITTAGPTATGVIICAGGSGSLTSSYSCTSSSIQTASGSGGTSNSTSYGSSGSISINFPTLPVGAVVTNISTYITYTSNSPSWTNELRIQATPPVSLGGVQSDLQAPSTTSSAGTITAGIFGTWGTGSPVGSWSFRFRETTNDSGVSPDANISNISIIVTYTVPSSIQWYTTPNGGTAIGSGASFNPVGVANSGLANTNTAGTTIFYAACSTTPECRTAVNFVINPTPSTPVTAVTQPNCSELTGTITLSGLPPSGNWTVTRSPGNVTTTGTGETTIISGLAAGSYTFTVTPQGSCTSLASNSVSIIAFSRAIVVWNGTSFTPTPTIEDRVEFRGPYTSGENNAPANVNACSCYVMNNAVVTFKKGHTLNVLNEVRVESGSLTFESEASLVQHKDVPFKPNFGSITYERKTTITRYDYTYWSSPVVGRTLKQLSPYTLFDRYFTYNNGWVLSRSGVDEMFAGHGYIVRGPQNSSITTPAVFTGIFVGNPHNGVYNGNDLAVVADKDYLLGNPYPSAIDADKFLTLNSDRLQGTLYFWTHNTEPTATTGTTTYKYISSDYASYNRTGGTGTGGVIAGTGGKIPNGKIGAGQGFFARATAAPVGNVLFNNSMRLGATQTTYLDNTQFFKVDTGKNAVAAVTTTEKNRVWLNLTNTEGAFKQILVGYVTGATNDYDNGFDGVTYNGNQYVDFYSVNQDKNLVIQGRALPFVKKDSVALGYNTTIKGDFKISIDQVDGIFTTQNVLLEDKELKVQHDLKKEAYTFSTEKGTFNNRFVLRYVDKNAVDEVVIPEVPGQDSDAAVMVSVKDQEIKINSVVTKLDKVVVYDVAGRKLFQKNKIDANVLLIPHFVWNHQVLVVDIVLTDGTKHSRKIIN